MRVRIQKIISSRGVASRRTAEEMLRQGRVTVNGETATIGQSADPALDTLCIDGKKLEDRDPMIYIMLHKPRGYITTMNDELGRKTASELVDCGCRVYPVGRLDALSEGLLLFTNDGALANHLMHPRGRIPKVYEVTVRGALKTAEEMLSRRIELDGTMIQKPLVHLLRTNGEKATFQITIFEGKNRQIRRMCQAAELSVARLCRVKEGSLALGKLPVGKWRYLTQREIDALRTEGE